MDPLAEKYPNISSYVYCADNPVKFIDPDGERIFIANGSNDFQHKTFSDMQKLTNKTLVLLRSGEVVQLTSYKGDKSGIVEVGKRSLNRNRHMGTGLIAMILGNKQKYLITETNDEKGDVTIPKNTGHDKDIPKGYDGLIKYNPNDNGKDILQDNPNQGEHDLNSYGLKAFLQLGHEFIHAIKAMLGRSRDNIHEIYNDPDNEHSNRNITEEEVHTREKGNLLNKENCEPLRPIPISPSSK